MRTTPLHLGWVVHVLESRGEQDMDITLWIAAGLLALVALTGGFTKTFIPKEKLEHHEGAAWTRNVSPAFVRTLGVLELLGDGQRGLRGDRCLHHHRSLRA
jgi:hypothetical protein